MTGAQFQIAKMRHKITSLVVISRIFSSKFQHIDIISVFDDSCTSYSKFVKLLLALA